MIKYAAIAILLAAIAAAGLQTYRLQDLRTSVAEQQRDAAQDFGRHLDKVRQDEHGSAARIAAIAEGTQNEIADIKARTDAIPAAIRAGNIRLRQYWTNQASLPATRASAGQPGATQQRRADSAARIVRAADTCDAQNAALRQVVIEDRKLCNGQGTP